MAGFEGFSHFVFFTFKQNQNRISPLAFAKMTQRKVYFLVFCPQFTTKSKPFFSKVNFFYLLSPSGDAVAFML